MYFAVVQNDNPGEGQILETQRRLLDAIKVCPKRILAPCITQMCHSQHPPFPHFPRPHGQLPSPLLARFQIVKFLLSIAIENFDDSVLHMERSR